MSTAPDSAPETVDPTRTTKPPFFRRPVVWIAAGAVVLILLAGGIVAFVSLHGRPATASLARAATNAPVSPKTHKSAQPTPTPTPTPTSAVPQPAAAAAPPAAPAPAQPAAPAAPAAPPPIHIVTTGIQINSFSAYIEPGNHCPVASTAGSFFDVDLSWNTSNGDVVVIKDTSNNINPGGPSGSEVGAIGTRTVRQFCKVNGAMDTYTLTVSTSKVGATVKSETQSRDVVGQFYG